MQKWPPKLLTCNKNGMLLDFLPIVVSVGSLLYVSYSSQDDREATFWYHH